MKKHEYFVYIMVSKTGTLYVGVTNDLVRRTFEHKYSLKEGFTKKYKCHRLVFYEEYKMINDAISREKQIKRWNRNKKENLIKIKNPEWLDLAIDWFGSHI
ncbi:GIY-YIG nuclease family protein [Candidatus Parcubacteria bacterium]|jgi:putative endonuclease|nr:GIY-YIG nuclease family protein [Candidatus Parcubacteria bacterium]MBT3949363.1 GIY-YIG nuclease family protein [Candidatus Parcubacteria bacterium]